MTDGTDNARKVELIAIDGIMSSESGRSFMMSLIEHTGVFTETFDADTHRHAKNAGRREIGLHLVRELKEASFDKYIMMIREHEDGR